jgi:16S rRNA (cytidine1402-2'-O)-methyltransferase
MLLSYHEKEVGFRVGKIILLNTPIGNLGDLSPRVQEALREGQYFAVEDTRVFKDLLNHLGISVADKRIQSLHDQSDPRQLERLVELAGREVLYVASEAGSPIISDPAYPLVLAAYQAGLEIDSYSGVSSPIMALELSGLPPLPFQFHGFLPREESKRARAFSEAGQGTHIFFEAPTRIEKTLDELAKLDPELQVALVRELSKKFQQVLRFRSGEWPQIRSQLTIKGEFVLMFHRKESLNTGQGELKKMAQELLTEGATPKAVARLLSLILERPTKEIYAELNRQKKDL